MKSLLVPTVAGKPWWVVTHDLSFATLRLHHLRPIHVFTFLAQHLVAPPKKGEFYRKCLALENKLYAVRLFHFELRSAIAEFGDAIYPPMYVRDYDEDQRVIAHLEAYLNAIYTTLELTAQINRVLHTHLPMGFRTQSKKFALFSFGTWKFLPHFYDVRSELTHFGSTLPIVEEGKLSIQFTTAKKLELFPAGPAEILLSDILTYSQDLFDMLDSWAREELKAVDAETEVTTSYQLHPQKPLKHKQRKVGYFLKLIQPPKKKSGA